MISSLERLGDRPKVDQKDYESLFGQEGKEVFCCACEFIIC